METYKLGEFVKYVSYCPVFDKLIIGVIIEILNNFQYKVMWFGDDWLNAKEVVIHGPASIGKASKEEILSVLGLEG